MLLKGYIEGYYGRLLSWRERVEMVKALGEAKADQNSDSEQEAKSTSSTHE